MNRQIKFRGKTLNGEYVFGNYHYSADNKFHYILNQEKFIYVDDEHILYLHPSEVHVVIPKSIGQFTGLYDKNGKEIYEGDILAKSNRSGWDLENFVAHEVFFHDNDMCESSIGFQMNRHHFKGSICGTNEYYKFIPKNTKQFEVIGNVFENPDLVKL